MYYLFAAVFLIFAGQFQDVDLLFAPDMEFFKASVFLFANGTQVGSLDKAAVKTFFAKDSIAVATFLWIVQTILADSAYKMDRNFFYETLFVYSHFIFRIC